MARLIAGRKAIGPAPPPFGPAPPGETFANRVSVRTGQRRWQTTRRAGWPPSCLPCSGGGAQTDRERWSCSARRARDEGPSASGQPGSAQKSTSGGRRRRAGVEKGMRPLPLLRSPRPTDSSPVNILARHPPPSCPRYFSLPAPAFAPPSTLPSPCSVALCVWCCLVAPAAPLFPPPISGITDSSDGV